MKVTGEYMGKRDDMLLEVVEKEQNRKLVTRQTEGQFKLWESGHEFQGGPNKIVLLLFIRLNMNYQLLERLVTS